MSNEYTLIEKQSLLEQAWTNFSPQTFRSRAVCPHDSFQMTAKIEATEQPRADISVNCPACGYLLIESDLDPKAETFRDWTDDEKQELVDRNFQGLPVFCPVDGTAFRGGQKGPHAIFHCHRCGRNHSGDIHHRIGSRPLQSPIDTTSVMRLVPTREPHPQAVPKTPMEKRYQVFVSSTFQDLQVERHSVTWALLSMNCLPAGMEVFPASADDPMTLIKRVIDDSDYYLLIIAARYGSVGANGIGFTEMEYDYAVEKNKPVIAFLHKSPTSLPRDKWDEDVRLAKKLEAFRAKVQRTTVNFWSTPGELSGQVSTSVFHLMRSHDAEGWVRSRYTGNTDEVKRLTERIMELEAQLKVGRGQAKQSLLSTEAAVLLENASKSKNARIVLSKNLSGYNISAGGFRVQESVEGARIVATYKKAIDELVDRGFIERLSEQVYGLTADGFERADHLVD